MNEKTEEMNLGREVLAENNIDAKVSETIASLEKQLAKAQDERLEERFIFVIFILILVDIILLNGATNTWIAIIVLVFQLIVVSVIATKMGVKRIVGIMNRLLGLFVKK